MIAVALWVVGLLILGPVSDESKGPKVLAQYKAHDGRILLGAMIFLIGVAVFFFFLGALRSRLLAAEGANSPLTAVAFAGGVAAGALLSLFPGADAAGALAKDDLDQSAAVAIHNLGTAFFIGAEYIVPVLLVATALIALRTRVLPVWLAWVTLLIALLLLIGPIGWAALIFAFPLWVVVVSVLLWLRPPEAARAA